MQGNQGGRSPAGTQSGLTRPTDSTQTGTADAGLAGGRGPGGHGPGPLGEAFSFTLSGGSVTAASVALPSGDTLSLPLDGKVTYTVEGSDVLATRSNDQGTHTVRYSDADADGLYAVVSTARVMTAAPETNEQGIIRREVLDVTLDATGTTVTEVSRTLPNGTEHVLLSSTVARDNVTWTVQNGLVVEVITNDAGQVRWEVFRDGNADGQYTEVASGTGTLVDLVGVVAATDAVAASL